MYSTLKKDAMESPIFHAVEGTILKIIGESLPNPPRIIRYLAHSSQINPFSVASILMDTSEIGVLL